MEQMPGSTKELDETALSSKSVRRRKLGMILVLIGVLLLVIISSFIGLTAYQNHVTLVSATAVVNAQSTATSVSFQTTLNAQNTATAITGQATASALATANPLIPANNPYPSYMSGQGTLVLLDTLHEQYQWFGGESGCVYRNGAYDVSRDAGVSGTCSGGNELDNFAMEIHFKVIQGDCSEIQIRSFYSFEVCSDSTYAIWKGNINDGTELASGSSSAILKGIGVDNTIGIVANGSFMQLYVNRQKINSITDDADPTGYIGLGAVGITHPTTVAFSDLRVWA